jgi:PTH2 family peptidyl-tRNA hydrolase
MTGEVKQVIVIRRDLGMRRGKEIAQGAHASMAWLTARLERLAPMVEFSAETRSDVVTGMGYRLLLSPAEEQWVKGSFAKIVCQVGTLDELLDLRNKASEAGLVYSLIKDAGRTEFHGEVTPTALAIGPDYAEKVDPVTSGLQLY